MPNEDSRSAGQAVRALSVLGEKGGCYDVSLPSLTFLILRCNKPCKATESTMLVLTRTENDKDHFPYDLGTHCSFAY
jgi:hypothetical protein